MREGYKVTEIGDIPEDWDLLQVSDLVKAGAISKVQDGNHGESHPVASDFVDNGIPFIMANCITKNNKLILDGAKRISVEQAKKLRIGHSKYPDVLLTHKGTVGLTALVERMHGEIMLTPQVTAYKVVENEKLDRCYLYYFFQSSGFQSKVDQLSKQSTRAYIGITAQQKLPLILPPLPEQQKIACILSTVDEKIENIDAQICQTQELKKGLMQQLLTKGIGHTKFKSSELGDIPESWEVVKLGDCTSLMTNGFVGTATPFYTEDSSGVFYVQGYNVKEGRFRLNGIKRVTSEFHIKQKKSILKCGDVLTVQTGAIGLSAVVNEDFEGANCHALIISRPISQSLDSHYLCYYLNSEAGKRQCKVIEVGTTMKHINVSDFFKFKIPLPPLPEQKEIAEILLLLDEKLISLESRKETYQQLKKGLMQQLLTGKIRVKLSSPEPALA